MNERIRELATKAILQCVDENGFLGKDKSIRINPGNYVDQAMVQDFIEVFCELIVEECVNIVENNNPCPPGTIKMYHLDQDEYFDRGWQVAVETKSNQIQKHFGVEE